VRRTAAVVAVGVLGLLAGCTNGSSAGSSATATGRTGAAPVAVSPAAVAVTPADGAEAVAPSTPVRIGVSGGELAGVTVATVAGRPVPGTVTDAPAGSAAASSSASSSAAGSSSSSAPASGSPAPAGDRQQLWVPAQPLAYGTTYTLTATARNAAQQESTTRTTFSTVAPRKRSVPSIGPLDGTTVGVALPIRVYFDQAVPAAMRAEVERHLVVTSSRPTDGTWSWLSATEVHYRPSTYWPADTDVTVKAGLYGVQLADGVWGQKDRTVSFHVGDRHVSVADAGSHTLTVRDGNQVVKTFPMSAGSTANPSHNGIHVVTEMNRRMVMDSSTFGLAVDAPGGYRADVEYAVRISNNGEFVHAAPWSVAQQGRSNVSHGCVNLSTADAAWFFDFSQPGDAVEVDNSIGPDLGRADGDIYDWTVPWSAWQAGSALH
jgi:lipoprotein-anchoring transpeptidase ErfK/SrfK